VPLWTPSRTSTHLWLDAADASTIFDAASGGSLTANGGNVGRIQDKSGNLRHATQSTAGLRPVRNGSAIDFTARWLTVPTAAFAANRCIVGVFNSSATSSNSSTGFLNIANATWNPEIRLGIGASGNDAGVYSGDYYFSAATSYSLATSSVFAFDANSDDTMTLYRNGTSAASGTRSVTWASLTEFRIGSYSVSGTRNGSLRELVICNRSDRQLAEGYLAWKWSLQGSLDASHPYREAAPSYGGSSPINGQSLIRPAGSAAQQLLIQGAIP